MLYLFPYNILYSFLLAQSSLSGCEVGYYCDLRIDAKMEVEPEAVQLVLHCVVLVENYASPRFLYSCVMGIG